MWIEKFPTWQNYKEKKYIRIIQTRIFKGSMN